MPVLEWQALQKPSTTALPRPIPFGGCLDLEVGNRSAADMLLDHADDRERGNARHRDDQHGG
jgi:hypothetical protein